MTDQVCSFELATKLKTLGIEGESIWWWVENCPFDTDQLGAKLGLGIGGGCWLFDTDFYTGTVVTSGVMYSAFTASELAAMLPINKCLIRFCDNHDFQMVDDAWEISYRDRSLVLKTVSETLVDALANMVIMLKEKEII